MIHRVPGHCILLAALAAMLSLAPVRAQPPRGPGGRPGAPGGRPPGGGRGGAPAAPLTSPSAGRKPPVRAFTADGDRWAWLREAGDEAELYVGGPGRAPQALGRGRGWVEVALVGDNAWVLQRAAGAAGQDAILRVALSGGAGPAVELPGLTGPGSLLGAGGRLYWLEPGPPAEPGLAFVPAAASMTRLRCRDAAGPVRTVAQWPAGAHAVGDRPPEPGDLVGITGDWAAVRLHRAVSTEFLRVALATGDVARLGGELSIQQGALRGDTLAWTAFSEEANSPDYACVHRLSLTAAPGTPPETLSEWLPVPGVILATQDAFWYYADAVYRLPDRLVYPEEAGEPRGWPASSDGRSLIVLGDPDSPKVWK